MRWPLRLAGRKNDCVSRVEDCGAAVRYKTLVTHLNFSFPR
jgi:hypothetical protein